jgi:hypothetical protein
MKNDRMKRLNEKEESIERKKRDEERRKKEVLYGRVYATDSDTASRTSRFSRREAPKT